MDAFPRAHPDLLLSIIRGVRTRWRWKVVARSLTVLLGAAVGTILVAAYGLEQFRFSPVAIVTVRVVTYLVLAGLGWFFFVRPLARRVSDQQVALYLEEHEPSLSAVPPRWRPCPALFPRSRLPSPTRPRTSAVACPWCCRRAFRIWAIPP